jgi:hypothetical protein
VRTTPWWLVLVVALVGTLAAGCAGDTPTMMGARGGSVHGMGSMPDGHHVSGSRCPPSRLPGTTVHVMLGDIAMVRPMSSVESRSPHLMLHAMPSVVPDGRVTFVAANLGRRTHELVVLPLATGRAAGQRVADADGRVDENGSLGEASASCAAGPGDGIRPGTVGWVTLDLPPGRYELVCNLRHHYERGMHQAFFVR